MYLRIQTISGYISPSFLRYSDMLIKERAEALSTGQEFLTWNDVQKCIDTVNVQVQEEHERKNVLLISSSSLHILASVLSCAANQFAMQFGDY